MNIVQEVKNNVFIVFVISFFIYYNLFINRDPKLVFFIFAVLLIVAIIYTKNKDKEEKKTANISNYISQKEKQLAHDYEVPENKIFGIHKTPRNLKYLNRTDDLREIVYNLKFLDIYEKALYEKIISYVEHFLKIHYKVMIGKYEFDLYYPVLKDIRIELLNSMKTIYFNIPKVSTILAIKDIDQFVDEQITLMQSRTYKYMKILYHKYGKSHVFYQAPYENDTMKDSNYHVF